MQSLVSLDCVKFQGEKDLAALRSFVSVAAKFDHVRSPAWERCKGEGIKLRIAGYA